MEEKKKLFQIVDPRVPIFITFFLSPLTKVRLFGEPQNFSQMRLRFTLDPNFPDFQNDFSGFSIDKQDFSLRISLILPLSFSTSRRSINRCVCTKISKEKKNRSSRFDRELAYSKVRVGSALERFKRGQKKRWFEITKSKELPNLLK